VGGTGGKKKGVLPIQRGCCSARIATLHNRKYSLSVSAEVARAKFRHGKGMENKGEVRKS